jgi:hypothetical protein
LKAILERANSAFMSLKDQTPFFSDPPPWYFRMMAVLFCVAIVPFLCVSFVCLLAHEYWPVLIFVPIAFLLIVTARGLWQKARVKESKRVTQEPTTDA